MQRPMAQRFTTAGGVELYQLPIEAFPGFLVYAYLVVTEGVRVLVDAGSGIGDASAHLLAGFAEVRDRFGVDVAPQNLTRILITHAHIDHFGGLAALRPLTEAPIGIHSLDRRVLQSFEERLVLTAQNLRIFLGRAGLSAARRNDLMNLYMASKYLFQSVDVAFTLDEGEVLDGLFRFYHTPGHCPGQLCIQIDDILLTADHVLSQTTPHQAPESVTPWTGLGHYLVSLEAVERVPGVRLALGGHEAPIEDLPARIAAIRASHERKLAQTLDLCVEPKTISEVSRGLFRKVSGYEVLLAIEEAGAHVEYLYEHGLLCIENVTEVANAVDAPILYRRL